MKTANTVQSYESPKQRVLWEHKGRVSGILQMTSWMRDTGGGSLRMSKWQQGQVEEEHPMKREEMSKA